MSDREVELLGLCITLFLGILGTTWKASATISAMNAALLELRVTVGKLEMGLAQLGAHAAEQALLAQRVTQLEDVVRKELTSKVTQIWDKLFSLREQAAVRAAVAEAVRTGSSPDLTKP